MRWEGEGWRSDLLTQHCPCLHRCWRKSQRGHVFRDCSEEKDGCPELEPNATVSRRFMSRRQGGAICRQIKDEEESLDVVH